MNYKENIGMSRRLRECWGASGDEQRSFDEVYGKDTKLFEDTTDLISPKMRKLFESVYDERGNVKSARRLRESCEFGEGMNDCAHNRPGLEGQDSEVTQSIHDYDVTPRGLEGSSAGKSLSLTEAAKKKKKEENSWETNRSYWEDESGEKEPKAKKPPKKKVPPKDGKKLKEGFGAGQFPELFDEDEYELEESSDWDEYEELTGDDFDEPGAFPGTDVEFDAAADRAPWDDPEYDDVNFPEDDNLDNVPDIDDPDGDWTENGWDKDEGYEDPDDFDTFPGTNVKFDKNADKAPWDDGSDGDWEED